MSQRDDIDTTGLDPRLVAYLREHCGPHCYGEQNADGIDLSLIRANLELAPEQRLLQLDNHLDQITELHRIGTRKRQEHVQTAG